MKQLILSIIIVLVFGAIANPTTAQSGSFSDVIIDTSFPQYNRLGENCGGELGFGVYFTTERFTVSITGQYDFRFAQSGTPVHAAIYSNFDPSQPELDCIDSDGPISSPTVLPRIVTTLQADTPYVMVKSCRYPDTSQFPTPCSWLYLTYFGPGTIQILDDSQPPADPTDDEPSVFDDDRLNQPFIDKIALYNRTDENGNPALHIYCIDEQSNGLLWTVLTQDDIEAMIAHGRERAYEIQASFSTQLSLIPPNDHPDLEPSGCPYDLNIRIWVRGPVLNEDGSIRSFRGDYRLYIEIHDYAQRKVHSVYFSYPFPATVTDTRTWEY